VGAGPAGVEAARVASLRGHSVDLFEKDKRIGGQTNLISDVPGREEFKEVVSYYQYQISKLGINLILNHSLTAKEIEDMSPDVVIFATGSSPLFPDLPGVDSSLVVTAWDVLQGNTRAGSNVLVVGGGNVGLETAYFLAEQGKKVTVIEKLRQVGTDMGNTVQWHLLKKLKEHRVTISRFTELKRVTETGITVHRHGVEEVWSEFDTVVLAVGSRSSNELAAALKGIVKELYIIGDAVEPRRGVDATQEGAEVGCRI